MSRLINDDELKKSIHEKTLFSKWQKVLIETVIDDQPTIEAMPLVHGRWLWELADNGWADHMCSVCGYTENTDIHNRSGWNYCPNCGARMDG